MMRFDSVTLVGFRLNLTSLRESEGPVTGESGVLCQSGPAGTDWARGREDAKLTADFWRFAQFFSQSESNGSLKQLVAELRPMAPL